jgi:hypothetical protein
MAAVAQSDRAYLSWGQLKDATETFKVGYVVGVADTMHIFAGSTDPAFSVSWAKKIAGCLDLKNLTSDQLAIYVFQHTADTVGGSDITGLSAVRQMGSTFYTCPPF